MLTKLSAADLALPSAASTMPGMPGNRLGAPTRRAILAALLEHEPRTVNELAGAVGITQQGAAYHVDRMEKLGWLKVERRRGVHGSEVTLTEAGREVARTI